MKYDSDLRVPVTMRDSTTAGGGGQPPSSDPNGRSDAPPRTAKVRWRLAAPAGAALVLILAGLSVWAAPLLPQRLHLTDEIRSLARLERVELNIAHISPTLREVGVDAIAVRESWKQRLEDAGVAIEESDDLPKLQLVGTALLDKGTPDSIGYCFIISLEQGVEVDRLNQKLSLPTWTGVYTGMKHSDEIAEELDRLLSRIIEEFVYRIELATKQSASGEE